MGLSYAAQQITFVHTKRVGHFDRGRLRV